MQMKANMHSVVFTPQGKNLSALTLPGLRSPFSPLPFGQEGRDALGPADGWLSDEGKRAAAQTRGNAPSR